MSPLLGAHVSAAGGVSRTVERGLEIGCDVIQVFVKNASQWRGKALAESEVQGFRQALAASHLGPVVAHASYLINLAGNDPDNLTRSRAAVIDELERCDRLGIAGLIVHPGAHLGAGVEAGLESIANSLRYIYDTRPDLQTRVLLENTAGQGTLVGYRLDHLASIIELTDRPGRLGLCIDTCHAFAAGYAIDQPSGFDDFLALIDHLFAPAEPGCFHLNDSKYPLGARRDRHASIGAGEIAIETFARLIHEPGLARTPMILETPLGVDGGGHRRDLATLRSL